MQSARIQQQSLSADAANRIRRLIFDGQLPEGARINEVHLARELGVSRTPLREALAALETEGAIRREPRRGYFVRSLTLEEFDHLYPVRRLLDLEALRIAGIPDRAALTALVELNDRIAGARSVDERIDLDDAWHLLLVGDCGNPVLLDLIRDFMGRTRRYELAYLREQAHLSTATDEHRVVIEALRHGDLPAALDALRQNLSSGTEPIRNWLRERTHT